MYTDPPALELVNSSNVRNESEVLELFCRATGGNPKDDSPKYYYSFCFRPNLTTISSQVSSESGKHCPENYLFIGNGRNYNRRLQYNHRGTYLCRVKHNSNAVQMQTDSPIKQIDIHCVSLMTYYFNYSYFIFNV